MEKGADEDLSDVDVVEHGETRQPDETRRYVVVAGEAALQGWDAGQFLEQRGLGESRICLLRQVHIQRELTFKQITGAVQS